MIICYKVIVDPTFFVDLVNPIHRPGTPLERVLSFSLLSISDKPTIGTKLVKDYCGMRLNFLFTWLHSVLPCPTFSATASPLSLYLTSDQFSNISDCIHPSSFWLYVRRQKWPTTMRTRKQWSPRWMAAPFLIRSEWVSEDTWQLDFLPWNRPCTRLPTHSSWSYCSIDDNGHFSSLGLLLGYVWWLYRS